MDRGYLVEIFQLKSIKFNLCLSFENLKLKPLEADLAPLALV